MPRPRKAIRPVEKNISLPEDLVARVDLELYSDLEGKVPFGAWQRYVEGLIRADLERRAAQRPADDEVVFIDGVGAGRSSIKSCRDGVQWIEVGDRVYWPLSDSDAKRLQSACCGNGHFDGPSTPAVEGVNND